MPFDPRNAVAIELIVVTDDQAHARDLLAGLNHNRHQYAVSEVSVRVTLRSDLEAAVGASRGKRPVIVFLDCEFLREQVEAVAAHILSMKCVMAIECIATRPPAEPYRRRRLALLGVHLFDGFSPSAEGIALH